MTTYFNGSRNETLEFYPAICFTRSEESAQSYGEHLHTVEIDWDSFSVLSVEMTDEELREAIDEQEWPCDRDRDIESAIAAGYDAVAYTDVDEFGQSHDCFRILTAEAFLKIN